MCKASKYINELESLTSRIQSDYDKLTKKLSDYDTILSSKYHQLENANFNACEGYYYAKDMQEVLRKRRVIKNELSKLQILHASLKNQNLHSTISKTKKSIHKSTSSGNKFIGKWQHDYNIEEL